MTPSVCAEVRAQARHLTINGNKMTISWAICTMRFDLACPYDTTVNYHMRNEGMIDRHHMHHIGVRFTTKRREDICRLARIE